ncbi:hypothetical protein ColTof4_01443 [Colletotrichum tofieldiae]|nr:hypothetical protein ColTof3_08700 [Colletotrichum tofieldiae]GKT69020.1 hypothetical protein ColTof4_01443 [Colletotrichum tofieldiae]
MSNSPTEKLATPAVTHSPPSSSEAGEEGVSLDQLADLYSDTDEVFQELKRTRPTEDDSVMTVRRWIASLMSRRGLRAPRKFMLPWTGRELHHPSLTYDYVTKVFWYYGVDCVSIRFLVMDLEKCREDYERRRRQALEQGRPWPPIPDANTASSRLRRGFVISSVAALLLLAFIVYHSGAFPLQRPQPLQG